MTTIMLLLVLLNTAAVLLFCVLTILFLVTFWQVPASTLRDDQLPFVSVVVPARDEEDKIGRCLDSLINQNYPNYEIVVIDDRSSDATGTIIGEYAAKHPFVKALRGSDAPAGWSGKTNALAQATKQATGDWFLFTDADTCHTPESLRKSVSFAIQKNAELISFMPVQELGSFWERVIMPVLLGSFLCGDPLNTINNQKDSRAYAYGQYILIQSKAYNAIGGHGSVRGQILEDIVFARVVKKAGYRVFCGDGRPLYTVRMYNDLPTIWHGWTKNAYSLIGCSLTNLFLAVLAINATVLMPFVQVAALALGHSFIPQPQLTVMASCLLAEMAAMALWFKLSTVYYTGVKWYHFFLMPLGSLTVSAIYLTSAYLILTKSQVQWKGRTYSVNPDNAIASSEPGTTAANQRTRSSLEHVEQ